MTTPGHGEAPWTAHWAKARPLDLAPGFPTSPQPRAPVELPPERLRRIPEQVRRTLRHAASYPRKCLKEAAISQLCIVEGVYLLNQQRMQLHPAAFDSRL